MSEGQAIVSSSRVSQKEFWYRRIHSLTGVLPLSIFLITHFIGNMYSTKNDDGLAFNEYASKLHALPLFNLLELSILVPLFYHAVYGLYRVATREKWNAFSVRNESNWRYFWQRVTGIILFVFVILHFYSTRLQALLGVHVDFNYMVEHMTNPFYSVAYILGVASACFHWGNGLWGFLITWGLVTGREAQAKAAKACLAGGIVIFLIGLNAYLGFFGMGLSFNF